MMIDLIGYTGMALLLIALYLTREHLVFSYLIGLLGSAIVFIYSLALGVLPIAFLNIIFTVIAVYNLWKMGKGKKVRSQIVETAIWKLRVTLFRTGTIQLELTDKTTQGTKKIVLRKGKVVGREREEYVA